MHDHDYNLVLTDAEREKLEAFARDKGMTPGEMAQEFLRQHMLRIGNAAQDPRSADVIPFPSGVPKKALKP